MGIRTLEITPNNVPANNKVSFKGGIPVLSFTIGSQNALLDPSSIRIAGTFRCWADADGTIRPTAVAYQQLTASEKLGVYGAFNQLVWRSSRSKQVCEHIRHYSRFLSSYIPTMTSLQDGLSYLNNTALINMNADQFTENVIQTAEDCEFCCPLPCGMTQGGEKLNLMSSGFGGLDCEIHLTPDSQFFYSKDGTTTNLENVFYEMENVKIYCEVFEPDAEELAKLSREGSGVFNFNSISSHMTTLESTNSIVNFHLGLSRVISAFVNFVPSSFLNNRAQNGYLTYFPIKDNGDLAAVNDTAFLKMGERYPYHFVVDTNYKDDDTTQVIDPQVNKYFTSALIPEHLHRRCSISVNNTNRLFTGLPASYSTIPEGSANYGVGVLYDMLDSDGVDFRTEAFTLQMDTELDDANPTSAFLFVKAKQTLSYNKDGIEVIA
tara:strand:- start:2436 stop:3740 length:1305 start_codon:yes stop_codon:yes gene_type:complete